MASKNATLQKNSTTNRNFSYAKGTVSLNFTLNIDSISELKNFLDCLQAATEDVEQEIKDKRN